MGEIIDLIWDLPWYKVFIIAVVDDAIFILKLWPLWVVLCGFMLFILVLGGK